MRDVYSLCQGGDESVGVKAIDAGLDGSEDDWGLGVGDLASQGGRVERHPGNASAGDETATPDGGTDGPVDAGHAYLDTNVRSPLCRCIGSRGDYISDRCVRAALPQPGRCRGQSGRRRG